MQLQKINTNYRKQALKSKEALHIVLQIQSAGILLCALKVFNNEIAYTMMYEHADDGADGRIIMAILKDCEGLNIKGSTVGVDDAKYMILPSEMNTPEIIKSAFSYVHHIEQNEILETQLLPWQDFFGAYVLKNNTKHIFSDWKTNVLFANSAVSLLVLYTAYLKQNTQMIFMSIALQKVTISVYDSDKLLLHNTYNANAIDDILYHLQKTINVLSLNPQEILVNGLDSNTYLPDLQKYYSNISIQPLPNGFMYPVGVYAVEHSYLLPILAIAKYANH